MSARGIGIKCSYHASVCACGLQLLFHLIYEKFIVGADSSWWPYLEVGTQGVHGMMGCMIPRGCMMLVCSFGAFISFGHCGGKVN